MSETQEESLFSKFSRGEVVFKIITVDLKDGIFKDLGMVNTKEDYEKKLSIHMYQPLLFVIDLELRMAYLYDCLNRQFKNTRDEEFIFVYREIGKNEWYEWFKVKSYTDRVYEKNNIIEYFS